MKNSANASLGLSCSCVAAAVASTPATSMIASENNHVNINDIEKNEVVAMRFNAFLPIPRVSPIATSAV